MFSLRNNLLILVSVLAIAAVGCGDDDPEGTTDNVVDTGADAGGDSGDDDSGDDDTGDDDAGDDDTGIQPPIGCTSNSECSNEGEACIGGGCVPEVTDRDSYVADAASNPASYFWDLQLPATFDPTEQCCFDFDGDGRLDDGLGVLLGTLLPLLGDSDLDIGALIADAIADGQVTLIAEWRELTEDEAKFSLFIGENEPEQSFADRASGAGTFTLLESSFGGHGALVQFNNGVIDNGTVYAGPSTFPLNIPIPQLGGDLSITLLDARIAVPISEETNGIHSVDETREGSTPSDVDGGRLGGVVDAAEILGFLDSAFRACECAGVDPEQPVLTWSVDGTFNVACTSNTGGDASACDEDDAICGNISTVCGIIPAIGGILDQDFDGDGIDDSLSVGMRFALTGASITGLAAPAE